MKQPTVSVIVAVHNEAPRLPVCMRSLDAQTYRDFEVILVNNGSTDDSADVCRRYAQQSQDEQVRMFDLGLGVSSLSVARNKGIAEARGRYVTFVDADDWVEPEFLAEYFREPLPDDEALVFQGVLLDYSEAPEPRANTPMLAYQDATLRLDDHTHTAEGHNLLLDGCSASKLYNREMLLRHNIRFPEDMPSREDHVFYFRVLRHIHTLIWRRGVYLHYMQRSRTTLSSRYHPAGLVLRTVRALEGDLTVLTRRFGITDPGMLAATYTELILSTLLRAVHGIGPDDYRETLQAVVAHREAFRNGPRWRHAILTPTVWWLLDHLPESCYYVPYQFIRLRRYSLHRRGHRF